MKYKRVFLRIELIKIYFCLGDFLGDSLLDNLFNYISFNGSYGFYKTHKHSKM